MKKKSLYDIAMEQKNDTFIDDEKVFIIRKTRYSSIKME